MPKTTRLTGPSKADGTQAPVVEQRAGDLEFTGPQADVIVGGNLRVAGSLLDAAGAPITSEMIHESAAVMAASNPTIPAGAFGMEDDTGRVKAGPGAYNSLQYIDAGLLVADEPAEVDLATAGDTTTITLTDRVARLAFPYRAGEWYSQLYGTNSAQTLTLNQLCLYPAHLRAGTINGIGINCTTLAASSSVRLGIYGDDAGKPLNLIAEATAAADTTSTGAKPLTITATIPLNGLYWLAAVGQGGTPAVEGGPASVASFVSGLPVAEGTSIPTAGNYRPAYRQESITGALPSALTLAGTPTGTRIRIFFKYA